MVTDSLRRSVALAGAGSAARRMSRLRTVAQGLSVALFLALFALAAAGFTHPAWVPVELYFLTDPLLAGTAALAAGALLVVPLAAAGLLLAGTAVFGRVFCGSLCPLGACLDWTAPRPGTKAAKRAMGPERARALARWRWLKYALLAVLVVGAVAGVPLAYLFDPLAILWRGLALVAYPLTLAAAGLGLDGARQVLDHLATTTPLAVTVPQRIFAGAVVSSVLLGVILVANRIAPRLWCRVACPLGALLSLAGARPWLRRRVDPVTCLACTKCRKVCPLGALADGPEGSAPAECLVCMRCADTCPTGSVSLELTPPKRSPLTVLQDGPSVPAAAAVGAGGIDRRRFLGQFFAGGACALGGVLVLDRVPLASPPEGGTLRPPGSRSGAELLDRCVRCGVCMQACPTNVIQPDLSPETLTGLFAPELVLRLGGCDPACTRCGEVCPTGAIAPLSPEEKRAWVIGTAIVEADRCLRTPSAGGEDCRACVEVCPYEAFDPVRAGDLAPGQVPRVLADRCTGCGLCELRCPVPPRDGTRLSRRLALGRSPKRRPAVRVVTTEEAKRLAPAIQAPPPVRDDSHLPLFLRGS